MTRQPTPDLLKDGLLSADRTISVGHLDPAAIQDDVALIFAPAAPVDLSFDAGVIPVPLDLIDDNPYQPRQTYDPAGLEELAASIERNGLQQPPAGRWIDGRLQLVFGHRRKRAVALLRAKDPTAWSAMPVQIVAIDDQAMATRAWSENLDREDLTAVEQAQAIQRMIASFGWTQARAAETLGLSPAAVSNKLRLLRAPADVQTAVIAGEISERQAAAMAPIWDLPEVAQKQIVHRSDYYGAPSIIKAARLGDSSDQIRTRVDDAISNIGRLLEGSAWTDADLDLGDAVQSPRCAACPVVIALKGKLRCPDQACFDAKSQAWSSRENAALVLATGVPAMPAKAHWGDYEQFYSEDRRLMQAAGANAAPLCPNLRVSPGGDGLQMAGHDGVKLTCYHPGEKGCKCVAKLKREASKDGKAVWRSLRAQTVDALTAALLNPTPDAIRLVAGYHAPYDKREQVASWRLEDCIKTIIEALIDQAKPYDVEKKPDEARTAMEALLARAYISPPWSMAARIQTDNPITRIDGRLSVIVSWILAQTTKLAMPASAELQTMIDDTVAMLNELATHDTPERDQIAQQIDHANHSLLDMLDLVSAGYTGGKDIASIVNTPINDINAKSSLNRATYNDCRWARAVVRCQRENITKLDAINRRLTALAKVPTSQEP